LQAAFPGYFHRLQVYFVIKGVASEATPWIPLAVTLNLKMWLWNRLMHWMEQGYGKDRLFDRFQWLYYMTVQ
jgi:hypothetical protein